ncbi:MAG TPA: SRPBCC family protein [Candidatus Limnocylindrales bacterium]
MVSRIEDSIEVNVPVHTAYDQWTQFESFPEFMEGVKSVTQLDDRHIHWVAKIGGKTEEWDAEITHQEPDQRIAWSSTTGARNAGAVKFRSLGADRTEVSLEMMVEPQSTTEKVGTALGFDDRQVKEDLKKFKQFIESRGHETGAWRGKVNPVDHPR